MKGFFGKYRDCILSVIGVLLTVIALLVHYVYHREVPFMMDDEWYSTKLYSEDLIRSFKDIIEAQIWHYKNWGGRSMTHAILQVVLLLGENIADLLNVIMTILLGLVICKVADAKKAIYFAAAIGMLVALNYDWRMSMFWQSGAANYLYITVFILLFLHCYFRELEGNASVLPGIFLWIAPLGILAGWSNENMGPMAWILTGLTMFLLKRDGRKVGAWMYLGNFACLAGSVMVIIAPGNFVRTDQVASESYGLLWRVFLRCYAESKAAFEFLFLAVLLVCFVLVLGKTVGCNISKKEKMLLLGALLSWGAMVLSPHYPARATFGTVSLLTCVILSQIRKIIDKRKDLEVIILLGMFLVWLRGMYLIGEFIAYCWGWIK